MGKAANICEKGLSAGKTNDIVKGGTEKAEKMQKSAWMSACGCEKMEQLQP